MVSYDDEVCSREVQQRKKIRREIATEALQGILASDTNHEIRPVQAARMAVDATDALLEVLDE